MALQEEKPWVNLDQEAFLLLTHVAKGSRKFLLVTSSKAGTIKGSQDFSCQQQMASWTQINDKHCQKDPNKGNSPASQTRRELYLFQ